MPGQSRIRTHIIPTCVTKTIGVWRLWAELCTRYPNFEFLHGQGLGVLAVGNDIQPAIVALCRRIRLLVSRCSAQSICRDGESDGGVPRQRERSYRDLGQRVHAATAAADQARAEVHTWERRARDNERARTQIARRIDTARRDVYDANLRADQAKARAEQAWIEQEHVVRVRDALLSSIAWQLTLPLRMASHHISSELRRMFRAGARLGWRLLHRPRNKIRNLFPSMKSRWVGAYRRCMPNVKDSCRRLAAPYTRRQAFEELSGGRRGTGRGRIAARYLMAENPQLCTRAYDCQANQATIETFQGYAICVTYFLT